MSGEPMRSSQARADLESALTDMYGLARTLMELGQYKDKDVFSYLGGQLLDHHDKAMDAFSRIFKTGEYAENREGEHPKG